jgi:hypothetical protein
MAMDLLFWLNMHALPMKIDRMKPTITMRGEKYDENGRNESTRANTFSILDWRIIDFLVITA